MTMSARDFETIGAVIIDADLTDDEKDDLAFQFADAFTSLADNFDPVRFLEVCGITGDVEKQANDYSTRLRLRLKKLEHDRLNPPVQKPWKKPREPYRSAS